PIFMIEHAVEALAGDITFRGAIDGIADGHVVSGDGLGDGARRAANAEKPAGDFLPCANLGERSVLRVVEIDLQRLLMRSQNFAIHPHANIIGTSRQTSETFANSR